MNIYLGMAVSAVLGALAVPFIALVIWYIPPLRRSMYGKDD